jgi:hypothetical protein
MNETESAEEEGIVKALKWAGIIALVALPVLYVLRKWKLQEESGTVEDDRDIFSAELED